MHCLFNLWLCCMPAGYIFQRCWFEFVVNEFSIKILLEFALSFVSNWSPLSIHYRREVSSTRDLFYLYMIVICTEYKRVQLASINSAHLLSPPAPTMFLLLIHIQSNHSAGKVNLRVDRYLHSVLRGTVCTYKFILAKSISMCPFIRG